MNFVLDVGAERGSLSPRKEPTMTKTKTKKRAPSEGTRGPRKGSGGRPRQLHNPQRRSIMLCADEEWPQLVRLQPEARTWSDRVRHLLEVAAGGADDQGYLLMGRKTAAARSEQRDRWAKIIATDRRGTLDDPRDRSINLEEEEWDLLATLFPLGSWADKVRQAAELAKSLA